MDDQPLQLIKFSQEVDEGSKELLLNHENLNSVLEQAKNRPIAVISICGPTRQGKSFLLGYLVRYLEAVENDDDDAWMDWGNKTKPLDAFKFKGGVTPVTQGILIWSRPFFITNEDGVDIAVVLIDTQGTNSEYTTTRDMSVIAGLSLLTSSVVIFNFFTNLQEDVLTALNTYTQFGTLAMDKSNGNESPFQNLIFLIRDWNNPGEFPYGAKGGKSFLQEKLSVKDGHSDDAKQVRESIRKCFDKMDCYLLPPIGDKALGPDFTGSIAELNRPFALKLEDFINTLLNRLVLPVKKVMGSEITASELASCLEKYITIFNSDQVPTAETMWLATSQLANNNITEKALKSYREYMHKRIPKGKNYIPEETLARFHTAGERQALLLFKKAPVAGSPETTEELREGLKAKLKSEFSQIVQQNKDKQKQFITAATNDANTDFREQLEAVIQLEEDVDETKFYEESLITKTAKDIQAEIIDEFYEKLPNEDEDDTSAIVQSLESSFESILHSFITKNKSNRANAEQTMNKIVEDFHSKFQIQTQEYFAANKFEDNEATLDQACQDFKTAQSGSFQQARKPGKKEFHSEYLTRLEQEMDSTFSHLRNQHKLHIHSLVQEAETSLRKNITEYETELRGVAQAVGMNEAALRMIHSMKTSTILDKFCRDNPFPSGSGTSTELETKLKESLQQVLDNVINDEVKLKKEQSEKSYNSARLHCLNHYDQEMKKLHGTDDFILDEKLEREHERAQQEALRQYADYPKLGTSEREQEIRSEIKSSISSKFASIKNRNDQSRRMAESVAKKSVQTCEDKYDQIMQSEFDTFRNEAELKALHDKAKTTVSKQLQDICSGWDADFAHQYQESLKYDIEEKYQELKDTLANKIREELYQLVKLLDDAKTHYNEEMRKHFENNEFMNPANLLNTHQQVKDAVIMRVGSTTELTLFQREGLAKELDELLVKYKGKNYMNANSENELGMAPAIGIDLGTTYCCVAVYYKGKVHIIPNQEQGGDQTTPSYVTYDPVDGSETYGHPSKNNAYRCPDDTIYDAKRIIGRNMADPELQNDMKFWPFTVKADEDGIPKVMVNNGDLIFPEQVSAKLLKEFRKMAENFLNLEPGTIKKAVITVPAYFNDGQRQATVDAGELADLEVLTILNEPTAAAISYSMERLDTRARKIVVYDLGGGTFDVVILDMKTKDIDVLGVSGDTHLGGEDFDKNMMTYCAERFRVETGIDLFAGKDSSEKQKRDESKRRLRRLQTYCEKAKRELSTGRRAKVSVDGLAEGKDLCVEITRDKFDELNMAYFQKTIELLDGTLKAVGIRKQDIDDVVLVGGSSRIVKVQEMLTRYFEGKALNKSIHPDHAVAYGAAVQAAMLNGEQAKGKLDFGQIQDVTPFSLGTEIVTEGLSVIIPKNSKIPIKKMKVYSTVVDNQATIEFKIYQGEDLQKASNNKLLGVFELMGIPPSVKETERIEVWMTVNSVGILHVEAICKSTKAVSSLTVVENKSRMSTETKKRLMTQTRSS